MGRRNPLSVLCLLHAVVGGFNMGNAQAQPPPPPQQLTATVSRTVSTVITVAISAFFVLVFFCVLVNQCRSSEDAGPGDGGGQGSNGRRRRGLDPAAVAALLIVPYAEIRKHKSGVLECAVCLTEFDGGDDLRLLPQCSHAFHPDCIDPWLEGHVTCPLCRANLEKQPAPSLAVELSSSPETELQTPEAVEVVPVEVESDEDERREEAVELERLRSVRRAARMPRSHSTGHSLSTTTTAPAPAEVGDDHERFTVRLPPHVREEVLKSRRLRHATSLVASLGSSMGGVGSSWHGARRWPSFLARTVSWARGGVGEGSVRRGGVGAETIAKGTALP